jgi:uncharacterized membrane protein (UPF0127 family)
MSSSATIQNLSQPLSVPIRVRKCADFWSKFLGLMFRKAIDTEGGALLVEDRDSILNSTIHMLFMRFDIAAIWINSDRKVVDVQLARRWRLAYSPCNPACFVLEAHPSQQNHFNIGDQVAIIDD